MAHTYEDNISVEAILRAVVGNVGGQFYRGGYSLKAEDYQEEEKQSTQPDQVNTKDDQPSGKYRKKVQNRLVDEIRLMVSA